MDAALTGAGWLDLVASIVLVGGLAYATAVERSARRPRALGAAGVAVGVALALAFVLTALRMEEVSGVHGPRLVVDLLEARWGTLWGLRVIGLGVLVSSPVPVASIVAAPWLLLRSVQGHAGAHGVVPALIDWMHLAAAAVWIGGLVQLALAGGRVPVPVAQRMRATATAALLVLVPAGIYGAVLHVQHWHMLLHTPYGRTLVVKVALAAVLAALGAMNHFRHVPAIARGDNAAAGRLARTVTVEIAVAAVVLICSALLGVLPMPHVHPG